MASNEQQEKQWAATFGPVTLFLHTLWNGGGLVRGLRQLVCWQGRHGRGWEPARDEMVESHQLIGPSLLPPSCTAVAKPDLWI